MIDDGSPIFRQIAERIAAQILDGSLAEEAQVPSTNEFAAIHRINPATAAKGVNELVDAGVLYKKRGYRDVRRHRGTRPAAGRTAGEVRRGVRRADAARGQSRSASVRTSCTASSPTWR